MIRRLAVAAALSFIVASPVVAAENPCRELTGPERAACEKADKARSDEKGRSAEMKGRGAQGKGQGAENGKGIAKQAEDAGEAAKDKAKVKAKKAAKDKVAKSKDD